MGEDGGELEAQLSALRDSVAGLCPPAVGEEELRREVRQQLAALEEEERGELLALVRREYSAHASGRTAECAHRRTLLPLQGSKTTLPPLALPQGSSGALPLPLPLPLPLHLKASLLMELKEAGASRGTSTGGSAHGSARESARHGMLARSRSSDSGEAGTPAEGTPRRENERGASKENVVKALPAMRMNRLKSRAFDEEQDGPAIAGGGEDQEGGAPDNKKLIWMKCSQNAFGAFIHVGLQSGLQQAFRKCAILVVTAVTIQLTFSEELITNHWSSTHRYSRARDSICWIPWKFQLSAVVIFVTLVCHNIPGILSHARLVFFASHHKFGDGADVGEMKEVDDKEEMQPLGASNFTRCVIYLVAVFSELTTFFFVLFAGCLFAVTADSVDNVIRSTVSVMFVLNVDEIVFESCCPENIQDDVGETEYLVPGVIDKRMEQETFKKAYYYYVLYGHLPLIMAFGCGVVFLLRSV